MFDIAKVQADILKGLVKQPKCFKLVWGEINDDDYVVTTDGFVSFVIPKNMWFLNPVGYKPSESMKKIYDSAFLKAELALRTGEVREIPDVGLVMKYKNEKTEAWFQEKYMKQFGKEFNVFITSPSTPALIGVSVESGIDTIIGLVCPLRVKE